MGSGIIRILLLAVLGLGSLWMIHLLAQDYNSIRQPVAKLARLLINKRDLNAVSNRVMEGVEHFEINWTKILKFDPFKCALTLICQLSAGAESDNSEAENINALIRYSIAKGAPDDIESAYKIGTTDLHPFSKCQQEYPLCPYSAKMMLKLMDLHSTIFGNSS